MIMRDIFITNMLDDDIQRELLRNKVDPERAVSITVNMKTGHQNQQRISTRNNKVSSNAINAIQQFRQFRYANVRTNQLSTITFNRATVGLCRDCGQNWTSTRRQVCPAVDKKCNHCGLLNHFAKIIRKKRIIEKTLDKILALIMWKNSETKDQPGKSKRKFQKNTMNSIILNMNHLR